jgi:alanine-glyoxylate transaminase/serine-glyoxylate transaminase/serine-pyruvate transaminase
MSFQNPVFIPGPTNIPDAIRKACDLPTLDHRSPAFARLFRPAVEGVRRVLKMDAGEVIILPSTGTGGWEAAISNTLSPGDTVLAARFGMFSHRWIDMCQRHGLNVIVIETPWGEGAPLAAIEDALRADKAKAIRAVLATHNETATGVKSDIAGLRKAMDAAEHPAMLFVDGVSSIGSMPFEMTDWGVDIAVAGSQKGFMLPAGLAILGVSPKAIAAMATAKLPRTFFDFADMLRTYATGGYPYTPAVGLIAGLAKSVELLEDEGLTQVYARHARIAEGVRRAVAAWGMKPCAARPEWYSDTVTAVVVPEGCNGTEVAGKVFRIGHLGSLTEPMMLSGLATAEMCMADLGWPVRLGSGVSAAQDYWRHGTAAQRAAA